MRLPAAAAESPAISRSQEAKQLNAAGKQKKKAGDLAGALRDFDAAITCDPTNTDSYFNRGVIYAQLGGPENFERAKDDFEKLLELRPNWDLALYQLGIIKLKQDKVREALYHFGQAATACTDRMLQANILLSMASAYEKIGDFERATQAYTESEKIKPNPTLTAHKTRCVTKLETQRTAQRTALARKSRFGMTPMPGGIRTPLVSLPLPSPGYTGLYRAPFGGTVPMTAAASASGAGGAPGHLTRRVGPKQIRHCPPTGHKKEGGKSGSPIMPAPGEGAHSLPPVRRAPIAGVKMSRSPSRRPAPVGGDTVGDAAKRSGDLSPVLERLPDDALPEVKTVVGRVSVSPARVPSPVSLPAPTTAAKRSPKAAPRRFSPPRVTPAAAAATPAAPTTVSLYGKLIDTTGKALGATFAAAERFLFGQ